MKIKAIILCKKNSQRLKNKNTRKFSNFKFGLLELKIKQLLKVTEIDQILISTDDEKILKKYRSLNKKITTIRLKLDSFNPEKILKLGYAIISDNKQRILSKTDEVYNQKIITINLQDGKIKTEINKSSKIKEKIFAP